MRLCAILLLPLAACDLVFGTTSGRPAADAPGIDDDAEPRELHPKLSLPATVDAIADGDPITQIMLTVPEGQGATVYYRLRATDGTFSTHTAEVVGEMHDGVATEPWGAPFAPAKVTFTVEVSRDPQLASPATTQGGVTVRQLLGHAVPGQATQPLAAGKMIAMSFFGPANLSSTQVVALGAYVKSGASVRLALYEDTATNGRMLKGATPPTSVAAPVTLGTLTSPVSIDANGHYWIAILGDSPLTIADADTTEIEILAHDAFSSFAAVPSTLTSANDGASAPLGMFAVVELK